MLGGLIPDKVLDGGSTPAGGAGAAPGKGALEVAGAGFAGRGAGA